MPEEKKRKRAEVANDQPMPLVHPMFAVSMTPEQYVEQMQPLIDWTSQRIVDLKPGYQEIKQIFMHLVAANNFGEQIQNRISLNQKAIPN